MKLENYTICGASRDHAHLLQKDARPSRQPPWEGLFGVERLDLKAKRKSGSVKFLSNEKEYTILSLFLWVEGGEEV